MVAGGSGSGAGAIEIDIGGATVRVGGGAELRYCGS